MNRQRMGGCLLSLSSHGKSESMTWKITPPSTVTKRWQMMIRFALFGSLHQEQYKLWSFVGRLHHLENQSQSLETITPLTTGTTQRDMMILFAVCDSQDQGYLLGHCHQMEKQWLKQREWGFLILDYGSVESMTQIPKQIFRLLSMVCLKWISHHWPIGCIRKVRPQCFLV